MEEPTLAALLTAWRADIDSVPAPPMPRLAKAVAELVETWR